MLHKLFRSASVLRSASLVVLFGALLASTQASAGRIDLSGLADGDQGSNEIVTPEGTLLSLAGNWFKATVPAGDFICPLTSVGSCGGFKLSLAAATMDLIFDVTGFNVGDQIQVTAQDAAGNTLQTITHASADPVRFSGVADLQMVEVIDQSTAAGFGFGNFRFGDDAAVVPAPGVFSLMLLGLFGMRLSARRKA